MTSAAPSREAFVNTATPSAVLVVTKMERFYGLQPADA
jgi:hypothetical protein